MAVGRQDRDLGAGDVRVQNAPCFPKEKEGCLQFFPGSQAPRHRAGSAENPTHSPKCSPCPWDTRLGLEGEQFQQDRQRLQQPRQQRESSERSHGMIKGKWRIDLGGKIKGAKSVALGSAVTKRGQDNSLQMCERCKYQTGGGEAARRAWGAGPGGWAGPREG